MNKNIVSKNSHSTLYTKNKEFKKFYYFYTFTTIIDYLKIIISIYSIYCWFYKHKSKYCILNNDNSFLIIDTLPLINIIYYILKFDISITCSFKKLTNLTFNSIIQKFYKIVNNKFKQTNKKFINKYTINNSLLDLNKNTISTCKIPIYSSYSFDWNFCREFISLCNNKKLNTSLISKPKIINLQNEVKNLMINKLTELKLFNLVLTSCYSKLNLVFYSYIIKHLHLKHLPLNFVIKKANSSFSEGVFIEKGSLGIYYSSEFSKDSHLISISTNFVDFKNKLKSVAIKTDKYNNIIYTIDKYKILQSIELANFKFNDSNNYKTNNNKLNNTIETSTNIQLKSDKAKNEFLCYNTNLKSNCNSIYAYNIETCVQLLEKNTQTIINLINKFNNVNNVNKSTNKNFKKCKTLKSKSFKNKKQFFKEDFQNVFHFFNNNIEDENISNGLTIIYLNNYNNKEYNSNTQGKNNEIIINTACSYEVYNAV